MYFEDKEKKIGLKALMKAISNPEERAKWDKDVEASAYLTKADLQSEGEIVYPESKTLVFH